MTPPPRQAFLLAEACLALVLATSIAMGVAADELAARIRATRLSQRLAAVYLADGLAREEGRRHLRTGLAGFGPTAMDEIESVKRDLAALRPPAGPLRPPPLRLSVRLQTAPPTRPVLRAVVAWREAGLPRRAVAAVLSEAARAGVGHRLPEAVRR